nr:MAG TPA: hypothetical protein [Caudoviricetes sp.]
MVSTICTSCLHLLNHKQKKKSRENYDSDIENA